MVALPSRWPGYRGCPIRFAKAVIVFADKPVCHSASLAAYRTESTAHRGRDGPRIRTASADVPARRPLEREPARTTGCRDHRGSLSKPACGPYGPCPRRNDISWECRRNRQKALGNDEFRYDSGLPRIPIPGCDQPLWGEDCATVGPAGHADAPGTGNGQGADGSDAGQPTGSLNMSGGRGRQLGHSKLIGWERCDA